VHDRSVQIASCQVAKSLRRIAVLQTRFWQCVCPPVGALLLAALLAKVSLGASDSPGRSINEPHVSTAEAEVQVLGVRAISETDHSWVVIDLSDRVRYRVGHLADPQRLYLDLSQTRINPRLVGQRMAFKDGLLEQIRMATDPGSVTRIVLDLRTAVSYLVSDLEDDKRLLVELRPPDKAGPRESIPVQPGVRGAGMQILSSDRGGSLNASPQGPASWNADAARTENASGPHSYWDAENTGLSYAGTPSPRNILLFGLKMGSTYDDNIFRNNQRAVGDVDFLFGPSLSLRREGSRLGLALAYQPQFRIYRKVSEQNAVDQTLAFDLTYRASPRASFRARGSAFYMTGIFQPSQYEGLFPGLGSLSSLNETLFTPTARQLRWSSRIDATYQVSARDSVDLFLASSRLDYKQQILKDENLQNTEQNEAGLVYQHRLSPHTTVGIEYLYEDIRFGPDSRTFVQSAFFSYAQQVSPSVTLSVFGGPQFSRLNEVVTLPLSTFTLRIPDFQTAWNWAIGGTLTKQLRRTAFQLTAQHEVSNGGGLLGAVVSSSSRASVRRQLPGHWDTIWSAGYADNSSLGSAASRRAFQGLTAGAGLERSFTEKLSFGLKYNFVRQRGTQQSLLFGSLDHNIWSVRFSYSFHAMALGR
jgi:opacity protein-like surface antigen